MPDTNYTPNVLSLALYFRQDDGQLGRHWIPSEVYMKETIALDPDWKHAVVTEEPFDGDDKVAYVANLSRLLGPGTSPVPMPPKPTIKSFSPGDLIVIPFDQVGSDEVQAYLVPRKTYIDAEICPPIMEMEQTADIDMMAMDQGVILANLPSVEPSQSWTCYLLSLISLQSGRLPGLDATNKNKYFAELRKAFRGGDNRE